MSGLVTRRTILAGGTENDPTIHRHEAEYAVGVCAMKLLRTYEKAGLISGL